MSINTDYSYYSNSLYTQQSAKKQKPNPASFIDSNEDKILGADELSNFVTEFNAKTGKNLDLSSIMSQYDSNGDGALDESEQESMNQDKAMEKLMASGMQNRQMRMMGNPPPSMLSDVDQDGDGSWNSDELTQFINMVNDATGSSLDLESTLQKYDIDGDGSLSQSEQAEMIKDMASPPSSSVSSDEAEEIRTKMEEILKIMEEKLVKNQEEKSLTENAVSKSEAMKLYFQNRISQAIGVYEKSFQFEDTAAGAVQYGV